MPLLKNFDVNCPAKRNSSIIQIVQAIGVLEAVLSQNDVFSFAAEQAYEDAPAHNGHVDNSAVAATLAR
jgi:hypothetical protein